MIFNFNIFDIHKYLYIGTIHTCIERTCKFPCAIHNMHLQTTFNT